MSSKSASDFKAVKSFLATKLDVSITAAYSDSFLIA